MPKRRRGKHATTHGDGVGSPAADFTRLGIPSQNIPNIIAMIEKAEESTDTSSLLTAGEAKDLTEILDKAMSSENVGKDSKDRFSKILCRVCRYYGSLPTSYYAHNVVPVGDKPHTLGGFANIHKGQCSGQPVRIKAFRTQSAVNTDLIKHRLHNEIVRLKYISHPNLLPFLGISETPPPFSVIGPWMPNGNIVEYTKREKGANRLLLLAQSACGLNHLHSLDIVHGNLTQGNILIGGDGVACLADFAISGVITNPTVETSGSMAATRRDLVRYMAPEQIKPALFNRTDSKASKESDVHSFAMTAYEVLTGIQPYTDNRRLGQIIRLIVENSRPPRPSQDIVGPWLPDSVWEMIECCWALYPWTRWRITEAYQTLLGSADDVKDTKNVEISPPHPPTSPPRPQGKGESKQGHPQSSREEAGEWQTVRTKRNRPGKPTSNQSSSRQPSGSGSAITRGPSNKPGVEGFTEEPTERKAEGARHRRQGKVVEGVPGTTEKAPEEAPKPPDNATVKTTTKESAKDGVPEPSERTTTRTSKGEGSRLPESTAAITVPTEATQGHSSTTLGSPPGSGDATGPSSSVDVKQPPVLARHPSKKVSREPSIRDTRQERGGGGKGEVLSRSKPAPPPLPQLPPPTVGENERPNHKVTQSVGGGTTGGSPSKPPPNANHSNPPTDSSTAGGVSKLEPSNRRGDAGGLRKLGTEGEVAPDDPIADSDRTEGVNKRIPANQGLPPQTPDVRPHPDRETGLTTHPSVPRQVNQSGHRTPKATEARSDQLEVFGSADNPPSQNRNQSNPKGLQSTAKERPAALQPSNPTPEIKEESSVPQSGGSETEQESPGCKCCCCIQ